MAVGIVRGRGVLQAGMRFAFECGLGLAIAVVIVVARMKMHEHVERGGGVELLEGALPLGIVDRGDAILVKIITTEMMKRALAGSARAICRQTSVWSGRPASAPVADDGEVKAGGRDCAACKGVASSRPAKAAWEATKRVRTKSRREESMVGLSGLTETAVVADMGLDEFAAAVTRAKV